MLTPEQIDSISFGRATFGGYDMQSVDEFLEPLTQDYITLYNENALLKSKIKILVTKLEERRDSEDEIRAATEAAQATCDNMISETEKRCEQMLADAKMAAAEQAKDAGTLIAAEQARVAEAQRTAQDTINFLMEQLDGYMKTLAQFKTEAPPPTPVVEQPATVADEISAQLDALVSAAAEESSEITPLPLSRFDDLKFTQCFKHNKE